MIYVLFWLVKKNIFNNLGGKSFLKLFGVLILPLQVEYCRQLISKNFKTSGKTLIGQ